MAIWLQWVLWVVGLAGLGWLLATGRRRHLVAEGLGWAVKLALLLIVVGGGIAAILAVGDSPGANGY